MSCISGLAVLREILNNSFSTKKLQRWGGIQKHGTACAQRNADMMCFSCFYRKCLTVCYYVHFKVSSRHSFLFTPVTRLISNNNSETSRAPTPAATAIILSCRVRQWCLALHDTLTLPEPKKETIQGVVVRFLPH